MGSSETQVRSLGQEDPLEKEVATHSSILAWKKKSPVVRGAWQVAKSWQLCTSMRVQVEFSLTPNSIDCKNIALRRPIQKFLAFGFLQKPVYLPHPELDLSYPFLLFPNIYPVFLPDSFPRS